MKKQSTSKGFAVLSAAGVLVKILSVLYMPFLLVIIGQNGHAYYSAAYQVYVFAYVLTNAGIPVAISKLISELTAVGNYKDAVKSFKIARVLLLLVGTIMSILMMVFAKNISSMLKFKDAYLAVFALGPSILFTSLSSTYRGYFQGRANMTPTAISQVIEQILNTIFTLFFAALLVKYGIEYGAAGGTIGTTLGALASAIYLMWTYEKNKKFKVPIGYDDNHIIRHSNEQLFKKIIKYSLPITISVGAIYAGNLVDLYNVMSRLAHAGIAKTQAEILYSGLVKYQQLLNVPITIVSALAVSILPAIAAFAAVKDKKAVKENINYAFRMCFLIAIPSTIGLAILSEPIFRMIFPRYLQGSDLMLIGSSVLIFTAVVQIQTTILQSLGKLKVATLYSVIGIVVKIISNYILIAIPSINIKGAVFGSMIGFFVPIVLNNRMIRKTLRFRTNLAGSFIKAFVSAAFMGLVVYVSYYNSMYLLKFAAHGYIQNSISTMISVALGMSAYLFALVLTGGIVKKDMDSMPRKVRKLIPKFILARLR